MNRIGPTSPAVSSLLVFVGCCLVGCASTPGRDRALDTVMATALSVDGQTMAVSTVTTDVALFDVAPLRFRSLLTPDEGRTLSWNEARTRPGVTGLFRSPSVAFSPNGKLLVSAGARGELVGWDTETGSVKFRAPWEPGMVGLVFFPDGRSFVTVGPAAKHWGVENGSALGEFKVPSYAKATSVAISPDGETLLVGLSSGEIAEFSTRTRQLLRLLRGHSTPVTGIAFSPDGSAFMSTAGRFDPKVWNRTEDSLLPRSLAEAARIEKWSGQIASDAQQALVLFVWLLGTARGFQIVGAPTMGAPPVLSPIVAKADKESSMHCGPSVAYSPDGHFLAATANLPHLSGEFHLVLADMTRHEGRVISGTYGCSVAFTRDSKFVVTGGLGAPQLWDVATGALLDGKVGSE